jgi:3D (Asp-Asp-Asp) domain-containing protein
LKYTEFEDLREPKVDFSKDNFTSGIIFVLVACVIIMGGLLHQQKPVDTSYLHKRIAIEYSYHQHYKRLAEERQLIIDKYAAERTQIVDVSYYTRSKNETDDTPNQTAVLTFARPGFTIAVSHDLKWMLGHYVYIYGKGVFYAEDLMGERWTNKLDILVGTKKEARRLGVHHDMEVVVLGKEIELYYE